MKNKYPMLITLFIFNLDISHNDINEEDSKNISFKYIIFSKILNFI